MPNIQVIAASDSFPIKVQLSPAQQCSCFGYMVAVTSSKNLFIAARIETGPLTTLQSCFQRHSPQ